MLTNADVTIYNRKYDKATRSDVWYRTVIRGVWLHASHKVQESGTEVKNAETYKVRVPVRAPDAAYLDPEAYAASDDPSGCWTLQDGDVVVPYACAFEIRRPSDLKNVHVEYFKITSWSDNRFGGSPHWRIWGV